MTISFCSLQPAWEAHYPAPANPSAQRGERGGDEGNAEATRRQASTFSPSTRASNCSEARRGSRGGKVLRSRLPLFAGNWTSNRRGFRGIQLLATSAETMFKQNAWANAEMEKFRERIRSLAEPPSSYRTRGNYFPNESSSAFFPTDPRGWNRGESERSLFKANIDRAPARQLARQSNGNILRPLCGLATHFCVARRGRPRIPRFASSIARDGQPIFLPAAILCVLPAETNV